MNKFLLRTCLLVPAMLLALLMTTAFTNAPVHAAAPIKHHAGTSSVKPNGSLPPPTYSVTNVQDGGQATENAVQIDIAPGTGGSLAENWTASNSFSSSVTVDPGTVSAQVGFNVTQSQTVTATCTAPTNTTGQTETLMFESVYEYYTYDVYESYAGSTVYAGNGVAYRYLHPACAIA